MEAFDGGGTGRAGAAWRLFRRPDRARTPMSDDEPEWRRLIRARARRLASPTLSQNVRPYRFGTASIQRLPA